VRAFGRRALALGGDMADPSVPERLVRETVEGLGRLDVLVNNAGTIRRAPAVETTDEDWLAVVEVDLHAVFRACRAAGRHMLARGRGKIVNVASLLSFQGGLTVPAYAAAKGGVAQLTKALANEWAARGVNVNAIAPGYVRTDNTAALQGDPVRSRQILERIPAGRWGEPADVAGAAVFLASPASDYVHGHVLVVDGGWMGR
jgi:2-deoxy-D-gluconate 3-dehydrogenase